MSRFEGLYRVASEKYQKKRERAEAKHQRAIANGTLASSHKVSSKKIQHWYSTRILKEKVEERLELHDGRVRINGKWNLQIRGKHMRRLKKKMKIKQVGRYIVRDE